MELRIKGMDDALKQLGRVERGLEKLEDQRTLLGSRLPYAYGLHEGVHRVSGETARKAGGVHYLTSAVDAVMNDANRDISEGLNKVTAPGPWILKRLALWARRLAKLRLRPHRLSGALSRSLRILNGKGFKI